MNKGIPCFEYREIGPKGQDRIDFEFVTGDKEIPVFSRVPLGDEDPMTGERITDARFFREYYLLRNQQVYYNKKAVTVPLTSREKERRNRLREKLAEEFTQRYGCRPEKRTLQYLLEQEWPKTRRLEIDRFVNEEGESLTEYMPAFADPLATEAFMEVENEGHTLDDFGKTLKGLQADVFDMLKLEIAGICVRGMGNKLAEKWGVDKSAVSQAKKQIGYKLLKWMRE